MMKKCFSVRCVFMSWTVLYFHSNPVITTFTISGNSTGTDGALVSPGDNLKLACSSSINTILAVYWYNKPPGNGSYLWSSTVGMKIDANGTCRFDTNYPVPTNMNCGCVSKSKYTCTLIGVETDMKGDMWKCKFIYNTAKSSTIAYTNELTIDLAVGITSTVISSPIVNPVSVIVNTAGTFQCQTSPGNPVASVVWHTDNKTSGTEDDTQITSGTSTTSTPDGDLFVTQGTLTLQVQRDDQDLGVYCRARNREQWFTSGTKKINVLYGPDAPVCKANTVNVSPSLSVIIGSMFSISCTADSNPLPNTYLLSGSEGSNLSLSFTGISRTQAGSYTLEARNSMFATGSDTPLMPTIRVNGSAVKGTVNIIEGNSKVFNCSTDSNPAGNYSWTYPRGSTANRVLQLTNVLPDIDDGDYTCRVQNKLVPSFGNPPRLPTFKYGTSGGPDISDNTIAIVRGPGATVACVAHSNPAPSIYLWSGTKTNDQLLSLSTFNGNTTVQCTASNTMTETNGSPQTRTNVSSLKIVVWQTPQGITLRYHYDKTGYMTVKDEIKVLTGDAFWLSCSVVSSPPSIYTWTGQTASPSGIYNITGGLSASQQVSCLAENFMQTTFKGTVHGTQSADLNVDVLYGPKTKILQDLSLVKGVIPCLYTPGNPSAVSFKWTRSGTSVSWVNQNTHNLTIEYVQRSDEASYTCKVSSVLQPTLLSATTVKYDTATFHLDVLYGAEHLILQLNNEFHSSVEIEEHSTNHMRCSLESDPGSYMALTKDGTQLIARNETHQLTYDLRAECSDKGVYTCFGYNRYGAANNASMHLYVKCSARRPPKVDVQLIYNARQHENASLVNQIVAYPVPKPSQFVWKRCMNSSCAPLPNDMKKFKIDTEGLSSNLTVLDVQIEDYRIYQLSVSNGVGDELVERFHLRPTEKPDLPTNVHIIQDTITDRTAVLTWIPGIDNGSPQEFHVSYRKLVDETSLLRLTVKHDFTKEMYYKIENLEPGTEYLVSLFAANEEGSTAWVNDTFQTLERISDNPVSNPNTGSIVGGAIGGTVGAIVAIVVIVVILRRQCLLKCYICPNKKSDNPGSNAAEAHDAVSMATGTLVYDVLRDGDKGSDNSHVYMTLNESSQEPQGNYENVKKEDPVYNNADQANPHINQQLNEEEIIENRKEISCKDISISTVYAVISKKPQ
ncbi:LOW QUALITY PROTEIN: CEAM5-like protein [Mya arenaria]|uniref:CEAM5-like protein n=1 Tax=Mya arenaria TaxID=6604 RepID=A0ABY7EFQ9_MYAAR|nr:LOW QUALITY PROTEIN: CEAM5-like protein [Mya arenaria]